MLIARAAALQVALLSLSLVATSCADEESAPTAPPPPYRFVSASSLEGEGRALAEVGEHLFAATSTGLFTSVDGGDTWTALAAAGLPPGHVNTLGALAAEPPVLLAFVWGKGLLRSADGGESFTEPGLLTPDPVLGSFIQPRAQVLPLAIVGDPTEAGRAFLAAPGGLYRSADAGQSWEILSASPNPGRFNLIFTDATVQGPSLAFASQQPVGVLPPLYAALVDGGVFTSTDDGLEWVDATGDLPARAFSGVTRGADGALYVSAQDGGLFRSSGPGAWESLGGPSDALALTTHGGGISVASGTRGLWRYEPGHGWSQAADGPVSALTATTALMHDGSVYRLAEGVGDPPAEAAGGTVNLALSFHGNLYHSYRGDTPDDDGYGLDIEVMRRCLDWLDEYPEVRADWDIENYFSVDGWLQSDAPDILQRIGERVAAGTDGVRIMSWNNGAVTSQTFEELQISVERAGESYLAAFGEFDPGVQPQENMFCPDHVGWYSELGIEWITLFNSASPFTAFPLDESLEGSALYNPITLRDGDDRMILVPVYHHADVVDHGGLAGWMQQIADEIPGDTLLVIHFDADAETWMTFDELLADLRGLDFVRYTTIQDYLDAHEPVGEITLEGDQADGVGDGFQSWAEKEINHEIFTAVVRARDTADQARALGNGDAGVEALVQDALEPRLLTLSTTNFGLAAPDLHPDRKASARAFAAEAESTAAAALAAAEALAPLDRGVIELVNPRPVAGTAWVEAVFELPASDFVSADGLAVLDGTTELVLAIAGVDDSAEPVRITAGFAVAVDANGSKQLAWRYDPATPYDASGSLTSSDWAEPSALSVPFTECAGARADGSIATPGAPAADARSATVFQTDTFDLPFCDGSGEVTRTVQLYQGLPGTVITVDAAMGTPSEPLDADSVALSPLLCPADVETITWRTFGGRTRTRTARRGQESWNGQSADGWISFACEGGSALQIAHRARERSSMAFAPLRNDSGQALIAPLGTLWGDYPWHDSRGIGGIGLGDVVAGIVGSQFNTSAPDWAGKTVQYRLLVGTDIDEGTLELFAHPPLVRVGDYSPPP
ncbi:MAG: hypothetical protein JRI23_05905 [Deltaproteobacteria bacterium]|jgi:hypothetical protein|nr:hypothetical protein [Deltaproteobacteria bacterium]MBW2531097.1 hypothetical protein [Deltaproteobacteria bacterium]